MKFCRLEFCNSVALDYVDLCPAHYAQQRKGNDFTVIGESYKREQSLCSEEDCQNVSYAKTLCRGHYLQQYRGKAKEQVKQLEHRTCSEENCSKIATTKGFCLGHSRVNHKRSTCSVEECSRISDARGYCKTHYKQWQDGKEPGQIRSWGVYRKGEIPCGVASCNHPAQTNGYCLSHATKVANYNMTPEQANYWLSITRCQACGNTTRLSIDHDHKCCSGKTSCGKCIRGVLCSNCNTALGYVHDEPKRLEQLITYLASGA